MASSSGDLSPTALYTAATWAWGGLSYAHLFASPESKAVFDATNAALAAAGLFRRDATSLRHALLHRHAMLDRLVRASGATQVLELAAGLSRRGAAFSEDGRVRYTELDLPHVVARKRALLERTGEGRAVLARPNLRLVEGDALTAELASLVEPGAPLFVVAEGLFMYLAPDAQRRLFARVRALADVAGEVGFAFDCVPPCEEPAPGAVGRALEAAMKRFTGGRSFERDGRTRADLAADLRDAGFSRVELLEPADVAAAWELPFPEVPTRQLVFHATAEAR
jgi:O-methyltransferase involved in polyketide biosynthesis